MPSTFSSWANSEDNRAAQSWDDDHERDHAAPLDASAAIATDGSLEELREELAVARRRLQYYEGFAPWIEEQMAAVVERAAEVAGESEREQARLAVQIEHHRQEIDRLVQERDHLKEESQMIVAEANATAEGVINQANARAARLMAEAHQKAEAMVSRLRDEAVAIVNRALGDLAVLDTANAEHDLQSNVRLKADDQGGRRADSGSADVDADEPPGEDASANEYVWVEPSAESAPQAVEDRVPEGAERDEFPPVAEVPAGEEPTPEPPEEAQEPGPFQWLRSTLGGREAAYPDDASNGANGQTRDSAFTFPENDPGAASSQPNTDEIFVTRLIIRPTFTSEERDEIQHRIEGLNGIERVGLGAVEDDRFELLITHQLFTSVLGSLLTAAAEHVRLIAQHDDELDIEVTGLDWLHDSPSEAGRGADA
jgi:F0F1-type ATP synthase membrane subunit b/b'